MDKKTNRHTDRQKGTHAHGQLDRRTRRKTGSKFISWITIIDFSSFKSWISLATGLS